MGGYAMSKRRDFVKMMLTGSAAMLSGQLLAKDNDWVEICILHTNDMHSRIDPFPENDPKYPGLGGFARLSGTINQIRNEEKNVILLDAGDIFQGTPYFNLFGGEIEFKLMSQMGYYASTMGNHDFDNGINGIVDNMPYANFKFINCNYDVSQTALKDIVVPYSIINIEGVRIGILGVGIELEGLVDKKNCEGIVYMDPIAHANKTARILKKEECCDFIICLSHLGFSYPDDRVSDLDLAKENEYIDLIIGGHTHTFLDKPVKVKNKLKRHTLVNQVGWAGIRLGKIEFKIHKMSGESEVCGRNLIVKTLV
jgi:5'-nucleotidase